MIQASRVSKATCWVWAVSVAPWKGHVFNDMQLTVKLLNNPGLQSEHLGFTGEAGLQFERLGFSISLLPRTLSIHHSIASGCKDARVSRFGVTLTAFPFNEVGTPSLEPLGC